MGEDLEEVVFNLRAIIVSNKGPIDLRNLSRDYATVVGSPIPYRSFNHHSLEDFLRSIESLRVCRSGDQILVEAAASAASRHVSELISRQKSTGKKSSFAPPPRGSYRGRGYRGRGRGSYPSRPYTTRPYRDWDQPAQDYSSRDYSAGPSRNHSTREQPSRDQATRDYHDNGDYGHSSSGPKRYSPNSHRYNTASAAPPLTVKVDRDDSRQVSFKNELPPRLQRKRQQDAENAASSASSPVSPSSQSFNSVDKSTDASNSSAIISPLGPSQLIAKAKEQQLQQQRNGTSHYSLSNRGYDLSADFSHLSHEDTYSSRDGSASVGNQHFSNRQNQIPENLPLLESEVGSLEPDEINLRNNVEILLKYCLSQGWSPPKYKITSKWFKDQRNEIKLATVEVFCDLSIGHIKGNSFPSIETGSEMDAKGMAAKIALEKIRNETSKVKADKTISSDKNLICNRISDIVAGISTGMFAKSVEDEYSRKYNEVLPPDWTYIVSGWPTLDVESTFFSKIIVPRVSPRVVEPVLLEPCLAPPPLPLEEVGDADGIEDVFITHATSVSHVWFRVIGNFSDEYEILLKKMDEYYKGQGAQELILTCEVGQYYAAHSLDTWFRVCVVEVNEAARTALAWLVDHGDKEEFQFESLYRLAPQFCQLPRQAVQCSLEGLESFSDDAVAYEVVSTSEYLIGKSLVAKITYKDIDSGFVKANLYDTSGEDDVLVNELIKDEIIAKSKPVLPAEGCAMEVAIGDVSKKGEVYIMFPGPSFDRISDIIDGLGPEKIKEHKLASFKHISLNKMYLAKFSKDENWYRAVVTATPSVQHNKIPVRFIDFGNAESVNISDIADLENLPPILRKLPPQAVKVALHNLPIESMTVNEVARLRSLLLDDEDKVVMIKTFSLKADPPVVEIFTKEAPKGNGDEAPALVSVNFTIEAQRKLNRPEENHKSIELVSPDASLNLSVNNNQDDFVLKAPAFQVSEFQPVLVVLAAHPDNFIFQPTKYANDMKKLRQQMVAYYETGTLPEVPTHRIVQNKLFAARYTDDMWYRVMVMGSPLGSNVPVRLCDHGDVTSVQISALRELAPEFLEYPFMAVKGKLSGVMPVDEKDWTPLDCVRFQTLVLNEILAGIVVEVQEDNENPMEMVVTLTLIDTNTDKDLDIAAILVQENRAVRIN